MFKKNSTYGKIVLMVLFMLFLTYSCKEDFEEDFDPVPQEAVNMVSHESIPAIISKLNQTVGAAAIDDTRGSVAPSSLGDIDMASIMEVLDSLENRNYTFLVDDNDNDPFTFTNLVVKKRSDGSIDHPYLLEYRVDSASRDEFLASKFAMNAFTGKVTKRFLDGSIINNSRRGQANLGVRSEFNPLNGDCDREYDYNGGTSGGGDTNLGGGTNNFGGGSTLICWDVMVSVEVPMECEEYISSTTGASAANFDDCYQNLNNGKWYPKNGATTTRYFMSRRCSYIRSQGIEDDSMCPLDESEGLGILNDGFGEYLNTQPNYNTVSELRDYLELAAAELSNYPETQEAALSIYNASVDNLSLLEFKELATRTWNVYRKLKQVGFSFERLSTFNQSQVATDITYVELYPAIKQQVSDAGWPLATEEWEALWEVFKPMLGEVLIEAIPGGGLTLAFRDIIQGSQNSDAFAVTAGVVALIVEFFPPGKVLKAVYRVGRQVRKGFKFVKYGRRYLKSLGHALKSGLKVDLNGSLIKLTKNGDEIGTIKNGNLVPNKYGGSGSPIGDPDGGYQLYKNGDSFSYKRTPDVSGYSQNDLSKLRSHPNAHTLERHGHDVSDEALIKRANTGIAPDGSRTVSGNPPPFSSKFDSSDKLKEALNNTGPGTTAFNSGRQSGSRRIVSYTSPNGVVGRGVQRNMDSFVSTNKVLAIYEDIGGGNYRLLTMHPDF